MPNFLDYAALLCAIWQAVQSCHIRRYMDISHIRQNIGEGIFGEISQNTFWRIKYWQISRACLCKNIIGGLNIGDFIQKLPITKVYSSPIFHLMWYISIFLQYRKPSAIINFI